MRLILVLGLFIATISNSQNSWPKIYAPPYISFYGVTEDNDGGYLVLATMYGDYNSYLLKFDVNAKFLWKKCLNFSKTPELWGTRFIKDKFKNIYIVGSSWDSDPKNGDLFILKLDSCYRKEKAVIYTDTINQEQQFAYWNFDFSDSMFFMSAWGFNLSYNQYFLIDKSTLLPRKIYNTSGNAWLNKTYSDKGSIYIPTEDLYQLKPPDTTGSGLRTGILKLNQRGDLVKNTFFGYYENMSSWGYDIFKNKNGNLFVFSIFRGILYDTTLLNYSPMLFECDTNLKLLRSKIFMDESVNQAFNSVTQFNDSVYFMATSYFKKWATGNPIEQIKFYKLNALGDVLDSFYASNWGHPFYTKPGVSYINMIKTFDNKIMCVFPELNSNFTGPRITFIKFDENFKLDTTEYRDKIYDSGCVLNNDSINISDAQVVYLDIDSTYPLLKQEKPLGVIKVLEKYKIAFYPNPIIDNATFEFENNSSETMEIILTTVTGQIVKEMYLKNNLQFGKQRVNLDFNGIQSGSYFLNVSFDGILRHSIKIIKE